MTLFAKDEKAGISLRPVNEDDLDFLFCVYASTREEEMRLTGWDAQQIELFLRMQFRLQHTQYLHNYPGASFDIILCDGAPAGRFYVHRRDGEVRIVDISLLPRFRGMGIGSRLLAELLEEADRHRHSVSLHVEANNPAVSLYERLGFRRAGLAGPFYYMERIPEASTPEACSTNRKRNGVRRTEVSV